VKTNILFIREEKWMISLGVVVAIEHKDPKDEDELMEDFKRAVTNWVNQTITGKELWEDSFFHLNIGDLALKNEGLNKFLRDEGIQSWKIVAQFSGYQSFDSGLVKPPDDDE